MGRDSLLGPCVNSLRSAPAFEAPPRQDWVAEPGASAGDICLKAAFELA